MREWEGRIEREREGEGEMWSERGGNEGGFVMGKRAWKKELSKREREREWRVCQRRNAERGENRLKKRMSKEILRVLKKKRAKSEMR